MNLISINEDPLFLSRTIPSCFCAPTLEAFYLHLWSVRTVTKSVLVVPHTILPQTFQHHKVPADQPHRQIQEVETFYSGICSDYDMEYISEMARMLSAKITALSDGKHPKSAITEHTATTGSCYTMDDTKILVREDK